MCHRYARWIVFGKEMKMKEFHSRTIPDYLRQDDVQARIRVAIGQAQARAAVTISLAANLFNFSESKLREWEKRGLLRAGRSPAGEEGKGHRQYTMTELAKLALIRDLLDHDFAISE